MRYNLPNTDYLRNQALKSIISGSKKSVQADEYISIDNLHKCSEYLILTEKILAHNALIIKHRNEAENEYKSLFNKAKIYVEHYFQSINMAIEREEIPKSIRTCYSLDEETGKLPNLNNAENLIQEAQKLFENDNKRISEGGKYFTNPAIGVVKVWVDKFKDAHQKQKNLSFVKTGEIENIHEIRNEINTFISKVWAEVENNSIELSEDSRSEVLNSFGVSYLITETEIINEIINETENSQKTNSKPSVTQFAFIFPD
ncbi:MAG: hypothetical protein GX879_05110 [Bacteroidales bacterium]|nr:hypothetical protein [Bacteroidales bacterium]